ncbi:MAG: hypothetical protein JNK79_18465 [Chitinophagaceae bacterium]|nr:hypothetical protein [Chitinophagaceae bacterium]
MSKYKRIALAGILFVPAILLLALPSLKPGEMPYWLLTVGRFHPVILHFPIVLIILALILELLRRRNILKADYVVTIILVAAALSTVVAIASGFLLFSSGDYTGRLLQQHFWIGVITGACILVTVGFYFVYRSFPKLYMLYFVALLMSNAAVAYTSHLGGSLTHGEDYLTEYFPLIVSKEKTEEKPESEMLLYEDMISPVLEAKCVSCHNDDRAKGEFSMSSFRSMVKGGESGHPGIVADNPDSSELYKRIMLPEDDDDRMPPEGKTPLTSPETDLIKFWIQSGAKMEVRVQGIRGDTAVNAAVGSVMPDLKRYRRRLQIAALKDKQLQRELDTLAKQLNVTIRRDSLADENYYMLSMKFPPARFTGNEFRELAPYSDVFSKISLVSSGIGDDALYHIGHMTNLRALYLQKTNLDGSGLIHLKNLEKLEILNLSYTKIDDKSVLDLLKIPNLREVYLFQTKTSVDVVKALQEYKPGLRILLEEGPYL